MVKTIMTKNNNLYEKYNVKEEPKKDKFRVIGFLKNPDFSQQTRLIQIGKILIFSLLVFFEIVIVAQNSRDWAAKEEWWRLVLVLLCEVILTCAEASKLFFIKEPKEKISCYAVEFLISFLLVFLTNSAFLIILYLLILTEIYISSEKIIPTTVIFAICVPIYVILYSGVLILQEREFSTVEILSASATAILTLSVHFIFINFFMSFYRQYVKLEKTLEELDESKMELQKAYDELKEVTALQERQRIAKDIHDTAGHSITTVIMQTEAAKLILDKNPQEAKAKIVAANLQAKHALEELRESVHLLSGRMAQLSLKESLQQIIDESTDGTGISIRSSIEDVTVSDEAYRFLCNTLKEGISNGLRHGGATAFWFELRSNDKWIEFLLSDNGCGMDLNELTEGLGLFGMKERAENLGGKMLLSSEKDEGFEIYLSIPKLTS